jgi:hypothetical protein
LSLWKPESGMFDLIFIVGGIAFFVAGAGYALVCARL